jgi:hypothetical protein
MAGVERVDEKLEHLQECLSLQHAPPRRICVRHARILLSINETWPYAKDVDCPSTVSQRTVSVMTVRIRASEHQSGVERARQTSSDG